MPLRRFRRQGSIASEKQSCGPRLLWASPSCRVRWSPIRKTRSPAAGAAITDLPNCVIDISNWNEDFAEHEGELVARLATWRSLVGTERILFASDQPSGPRFTGERSTLREWAAFIRDLPQNASRWGYRFTDAEAAAILGKNALRFYNIDEGRRT